MMVGSFIASIMIPATCPSGRIFPGPATVAPAACLSPMAMPKFTNGGPPPPYGRSVWLAPVMTEPPLALIPMILDGLYPTHRHRNNTGTRLYFSRRNYEPVERFLFDSGAGRIFAVCPR